MEIIVAVAAGIALAAACGFRVFVPLLASSVAARAGYIHPSSGFAWLDSNTAIALLGAATLVEILGYYIPWIDHALDTVASPAAVLAGTVVAAAAFGNLDPALKWTAALIAGGGAAGIFQTTTVATRALSGATTAGVGNPIVSTVEWLGAVIVSILAILLPIIALVVVIVLFAMIVRAIGKLHRRRKSAPVPEAS
ncbi:MAG TPA: DUF4126 domain-containing protein [Tepidisphaeraceae bacterium]